MKDWIVINDKYIRKDSIIAVVKYTDIDSYGVKLRTVDGKEYRLLFNGSPKEFIPKLMTSIGFGDPFLAGRFNDPED